MTLEQAVTIFEAFDKWCRLNEHIPVFNEYTNLEVLEAQTIILGEVKTALAKQLYKNN